MRWWLAVILTLLPAAVIAQPVSTVEADQTIDLVRQGQIELLRQELRSKRAMAIVNAENENHVTPLLAAIESDKQEILEIFLNVGGNAQDPRMLIAAAERGAAAIVEKLLAHGASATAADSRGWTALHAACQARSAQVVALLLHNGANPNAEAKPDNWRPIHEAVWQRAQAVLDVLLADKRTQVNAADALGWTPLHLAVEADAFGPLGAGAGPHALVGALLARGAKSEVASGLGETPVSLARALERGEVVDMLKAGKPENAKAATPDGLFAGGGLGCLRLSNGNLSCWGDVSGHAKPTPMLRLGHVERVAIAHNHACALSRGTSGANAVRCWGDNAEGSLGVGSNLVTIDRPMPVPGLRDAISIGAGRGFSCVVLKDGSVRCWGSSAAGIWLGAAPGKSGQPVTIAGLNGAVAVATTDNSACVLDKPGRVRCWGHGALGQLGHGQLQDSATPVDVKLPGPALALVAGSDHLCARLQTGRAVCWGSNDLGQLGNGASVFEGRVQDGSDRSPLPVAVVGIANVTQLAASGSQTCGIVEGARPGALCWGGVADSLAEADVSGIPRIAQTGAIRALAVSPQSAWLLDASGLFLHWGMHGKQWLSRPILWR